MLYKMFEDNFSHFVKILVNFQVTIKRNGATIDFKTSVINTYFITFKFIQ